MKFVHFALHLVSVSMTAVHVGTSKYKTESCTCEPVTSISTINPRQSTNSVRIRAGSVILEVERNIIRAFHQKNPRRELWRLNGSFYRLPIVVNHGHRIVIDGVDEQYLVCIDALGRNYWKKRVGFLFRLAANSTSVVYSLHSGNYRKNDKESFFGKSRYWKVISCKTNDGKILWERKVFEVGEPCAITGKSELWTIREVDARNTYLHAKKPKYAFELRTAVSGKLFRSWVLPSAHSEYGDWPKQLITSVIDKPGKIRLRIGEGTYDTPEGFGPALKLGRWPGGVMLTLSYNRSSRVLSGTLNGTRVRILERRSGVIL